MAAPPFRADIVSLLRYLLRTASKFNDYNVTEYVKRRSRSLILPPKSGPAARPLDSRATSRRKVFTCSSESTGWNRLIQFNGVQPRKIRKNKILALKIEWAK
ncbi:catalytic/ oxidoreductase, acting on NADH or NADPH [Carex littledalei]|uniref:Catalytic/ oxidoreductase, acting on NADH or NADPH n=1 Tax=Carex littledalei TaxID=544730 RepID=A0A833QPC0_9POAL|nr:catalytic/ oxidoreductase, acting on NADH or NADPH [Carex littledalei]